MHHCPFCSRNIHAICGVEIEVDSISYLNHFNNIVCPSCADLWGGNTATMLGELLTRMRNGGEEEVEEEVDEEENNEENEEEMEELEDGEDDDAAAAEVLEDTSRRSRINAADQEGRYHAILMRFMAFRDGTQYPLDHAFQNKDLLKVTPKEIAEWFAFKAFGKKKPNNNDLPKGARSSSLSYDKKALSYFMPNKRSAWNVEVGWGNPTRSNEFNDIVKTVRTKS